ncbi:MAG: hypothetical protein M3R65_05245 [Gemmatimonadota bacterium]|nr:hypothetical protein [Gemmatimonadota bacterium]
MNDDLRNSDATRPEHHTTAGDEVGEAAGGVSGVVVGAAIGSMGGPVGTVIGGIAGAIGGWWAGRSISEAATSYTPGDDASYRSHYESSPNRLADRDYESVSPAYRLGHLAAMNPEYRGKPFGEVEGHLQRGWDTAASKTHGDWNSVRGYAQEGYSRSSSSDRQHLSEEANNAANDDDRRLDESGDVKIL